MANKVTWDAPGAWATALSTELNSLADGGLKTSSGLNNSNNEKYIDVELTLDTQGGARDTGGHVPVYVLRSGDGGSTYDYGDDSTEASPTSLGGTIALDAAVDARVQSVRLLAHPGYQKIQIKNETGQALAATGNILKYKFYSDEIQADA